MIISWKIDIRSEIKNKNLYEKPLRKKFKKTFFFKSQQTLTRS